MMPISVNGSSNPTSINFNGTNLTQVYFNGALVWDKAEIIDPSPNIGLVTVDCGGFQAWLRDLTYAGFAGRVNSGGVLYNVLHYQSDITVEIPITINRQIGITNLGQSISLFMQALSPSDTSGAPDGYLLNSIFLSDAASVGLGCYAIKSGGVIGSRVKTYPFAVSGNKVLDAQTARLSISDSCDGTYIIYNDTLESWIYQGGATVVFYQPIFLG